MITIRSGIYKNKKLTIPDGGVRPTSDKIRQAIFNILVHNNFGFSLSGVRVLDAFAGTGAMGLEALSRGAARAWLMENNPAVKNVLEQNVQSCSPPPQPSPAQPRPRRGAARDGGEGVNENKSKIPPPLAGGGRGRGHATIIFADACSPPTATETMDLVFLDPPYEQNLLAPAITALAASGWIAPETLLVMETRKDETWEKPNGLEILDIRRYGNTEISFATFSRK